VRLSLANRADIRLVSVFGFKNVVAMAGPLVIQQTVGVLVTLRLGPAFLAVFARPAALVRYLETFVYKFAFVLMPMAGSIQARGKSGELRRFAIDMCEVGWALAIPGGVFLMLMGPDLVGLWMGTDYVSAGTITILAAGGMLASANRPAYRILFGLDRHGTASAFSILIYGAVLVVGVPLLLRGDATLVCAALVYMAGDVLFSLLVVPHQLAKALEMPTIRLLWLSSRRPVAVGMVSATGLLALSPVKTGVLTVDLAMGAAVHATTTGLLYWWFLLSDPLKRKVRSFLPLTRQGAA
jgi:O-antigen/teichoic acid export membrane protein